MAVITDKLKRQIADSILADYNTDGNYYYLGIGRSQLWDDSDITPDARNAISSERDFRLNLQGMKQIADVSYVVPRYNWTSGTVYTSYDDNTISYPTIPYYVITQTQQVYICVQQGRDATGTPVPSITEPTGTGTGDITTGEGYVWKYLYSLSAYETSRYLAANFMPVTYIDSADETIRQQLQAAVQTAATPGEISKIVLTSGGTGYSSAPSVSIIGDGTGAAATATVFGGSVTKVEMTDRGSGYTYANVEFSTGNATARASLAPLGGFGADARDDLKAVALMFNGRPAGNEGGSLLIDQDFRQVGLIRNPLKGDIDSDFTSNAGITLRYLKFEPGATAFSADNIIKGNTSNAKAYIDFADSAAGVYYHQTSVTGFRAFTPGETLTAENLSGVTVTGGGVLDSDLLPDINPHSGTVLYMDNKAAIVRSAGETQDIKIVIQL